MPRRLLLLSSSRDADGIYLTHAAPAIRELFGDSVARALFVPYAAVTFSHAHYLERASVPFAAMGYALHSIADATDPVDAVATAQAIVVGGGNTFHLLRTLYERKVIDVIRARVLAGTPYLGWSAGAVIAAPTIGTTNDMPIVEPPSFRALNLIPFQINAHFTDQHPPGHNGETRAERLEEFVEANPGVRVIGLREGQSLRITGNEVALLGAGSAPLFVRGSPRTERSAADDLSVLLGA